jgi:transcriptional regulator with XRE-family HTH domain
MTEPLDPSICRLRLRRFLRQARVAAGLSQREVAQALDWSLSKPLRIESGAVGVSTTDLRALLDLYHVIDTQQVSESIRWAQASRRPAPSAYRDVLSAEFTIYLGYEGAASVIRQWEPILIPGLLQTEAYARAVIAVFPPDSAETVVERQIEARVGRQDLLRRQNPPELFFILDEAVVRRRVGPGDTMRRQLERLREVADLPNISIRIVSFQAGAHPNMRSPFVVLEFADPNVDDLLFVENPRGDLLDRDDGEDLAAYLANFFELEERIALSKAESVQVLEQAIEDMRSGS